MYMYRTICITNRHLADDLMGRIDAALENGCKMVVLREDDMDEAEYEQLAIRVIDMCREHEAKCMIHSFKEVAKRLNHPHIHLTHDDFCALSDEECVAFKTIGVSAYSVAEAEECEELGASYITVGPIFSSTNMTGAPVRSLEFIEDVKESVFIPVYAAGGIHSENAQSCIDAGADGVCMTSEFMCDAPDRIAGDNEQADDPRHALIAAIDEADQNALGNIRIVVTGAGKLGAPIARYLEDAGIINVDIMD